VLTTESWMNTILHINIKIRLIYIYIYNLVINDHILYKSHIILKPLIKPNAFRAHNYFLKLMNDKVIFMPLI